MPQNPRKTKGEILTELESIKDLLIDEDDIPILQEVDHSAIDRYSTRPQTLAAPGGTQTSMFDELIEDITDIAIPDLSKTQIHNRTMPKALGENPFLPQHIRDRLQGNNPPPLFDFTITKPTTRATGKIENRHDLVNELVKRFLPQIEQELRLKLLAMTEDELKKL